MPFFQTHSKSLIFYLQNPELYSPTIIFMMIAIIIVTAGYGNRQIIVIDKGKIVQRGNHKELIGQDGVYKHFIEIKKQSIGWQI